MTAAMEKEREVPPDELVGEWIEKAMGRYTGSLRQHRYVAVKYHEWMAARSLASPQVPVEAIHYAISQIVTNQNNLRSIIPATYAHSNHENMAAKHIAALRALLPEEKA